MQVISSQNLLESLAENLLIAVKANLPSPLFFKITKLLTILLR